MDDRYILYKRKSSDSEDKQILSLDSQDRAIRETIPGFSNFQVVAEYEESMSAKGPGRPKFNAMCEKLEAGEAKFIITWQLNRLARNPVDGGRVIWLVQNYGVKIITPSKSYDVNDILLLYVEFAMSNNFINDLRKSTARGIEDKLRVGIAPYRAPIGYYNDTSKKQGLRDILPDPERFPLVGKMWDSLLTGNFGPAKILAIATDEWGLRQRNGKALTRSKIYELFTSPFYYGEFPYQGRIYQGTHRPMITREEFDRAQNILGIRGKPRQKAHEFAFTGLMRCTCGSAITAHERYRKICSSCHLKYNAQRNECCPKCKAPAPEEIKYFCYYHCTRKVDPACKQPAITEKVLLAQVDALLAKVEIPQEFADWALGQLREAHNEEITVRQAIVTSLQTSHLAATRKIDNLLSKYLGDANRGGELISDEEYKRQKELLVSERVKLEDQLKAMGISQDTWMNAAEKVFNFAVHARAWFADETVAGYKERRRTILASLGLNPTLDNKILRLDLLKPLESIAEVVPLDEKAVSRIEPEQLVTVASRNPSLVGSNLKWGD